MERFLLKILLLLPFLLLFSLPTKVSATEIYIQSEAAVLMDAKSGQVLFGKNENTPLPPASITKIATAIFAIENSSLDEIVTVSENAASTGGTTVYLEAGEQVTMEKLIIGMLVNSGNDASTAIAEHIGGSVEKFQDVLNQFLKEKVGTENTHFTNPHGLYDGRHVTTAADMAKITQYALQNETFRKYYQMKTYEWVGTSWETTLITHHRLLKGEFPYEGITGGKNGFTPQAAFTLVTSAEQNGLELIAVTMKGRKEDIVYLDTIEMLDYGFENFSTVKIDRGTEFAAGDKSFLVEEDLFYIVKKGEESTVNIQEDGLLTILNNDGERIAEFQLTAEEEKVQEVMKSEKEESTKDGNWLEWGIVITLVIVTIVFGRYVIRYRRVRNYN